MPATRRVVGLSVVCMAIMLLYVEDVAFGAIVGMRLHVENTTRSSTTQITIQSDPDGTGPVGSNLRWEAGSNTSVRASITITPDQQVNQIQTFVRQVGTNDAFAFYVDGVKVGTVTPPSGGAWGLRTIDLASPIAPGSHQLQIGPNATLANRANVDWFELHNTGSTPSPAQCGDGVDNDGDGQIDLSDPGCTSSTDTDETNSTPPPTGTIVGSRLQAEDMTESSSSISVQSDPDGSGPAGRNLRWASGATVSARASQSITVPTGSAVNQIQLFTRQASGGSAVFAIYVDGTATANRVGTFNPPAGSAWGTRTVNLTTAIQPGTHTLFIGPKRNHA